MKEKTITVKDYFEGEIQVTQAEYIERWSKDSQAHKLIQYGEHFDSMNSKVQQIEKLIEELAIQSFNIVWERNAERQLETIGE
jgi:hypothetical protein